MNFQETGNKVPISGEELINYVQHQLGEFDVQSSQQKTIPSFNPYSQPIIYKTKDGKTIRIPDEIQKQALDLWYQKTGRNVPAMQQVQQVQQIQPMEQQEERAPKPRKVVYVYEKDDSIIKLAILIFAAVLALYLFFKMNKSTSGARVNTEQLRYYLTK